MPASAPVRTTRAPACNHRVCNGPVRSIRKPDRSTRPGVRPPAAYVHQYTAQDWENRAGMLGSGRALYDRQKFEREFDPSTLNLNRTDEQVYRHNPHMRQVFANRRPLLRAGRPMIGADRLLSRASGRTKYARRQGEAKTVEHWGQRKLLLSEIEFLTRYGGKDTTVVYAGAAPGTHTNFLAEELFPEMMFVLVDPAPFTAVEAADHVELRNALFTDEMADEFARLRASGRRLLFVSDIRSMEQSMGEEEKEGAVVGDMARQLNWVRTMEPSASMLKFRLPYSSGKTEYLDGEVWFPVWGPRTTSEARLIVTDANAPLVTYDHGNYEDAMYHFNTVTRTAYFEHDQRSEGLDHCYDCSAEGFILGQFVRLSRRRSGRSRSPTRETLRRDVDDLSSLVTRNCSTKGRTLSLRYQTHPHRHHHQQRHQRSRSSLLAPPRESEPQPLRSQSKRYADLVEEGWPLVAIEDSDGDIGLDEPTDDYVEPATESEQLMGVAAAQPSVERQHKRLGERLASLISRRRRRRLVKPARSSVNGRPWVAMAA